ncbi:GTPase Era [Jatrophihabitans sp. YIM 134969]
MVAEGFRSGFCAFVGRPNAGKSTLMNALVGEKVAITSPAPQTTRRAIRGIRTTEVGQLVVVDTPGLHRPRTLLGQRLGDVVRDTMAEVDVVGFCLPADEKVGPGDRYIAEAIAALKVPKVAIVTKIDTTAPKKVATQLLAVSELGDFAEIVPVSAVRGEQVDLLRDLLIAQLPEGGLLYPPEDVTDDGVETRIAELVREAALAGAREELPHSIAVTVEEMIDDTRASGEPFTKIYATIHLERSSQKPIVLGAKGSKLKNIGITARRDIEVLLGHRVHLDLHVAVMAGWQRDPKKLDRLGF